MKLNPLLVISLVAALTCLGDTSSPASTSDTSRENWAVDDPIMLPPVHVDGSRVKAPPLMKFYLKMGQVFNGPFLELRSGQLVEAIVWRHKFLQEHPGEKAAILVSRNKDGRVVSATTVYSEGGKLYASNQVVGAHFLLQGMTSADIGRTEKINDKVDGIRRGYLNVTEEQLAEWRSSGAWGPAFSNTMATLAGAGPDVDFGDATGGAYNQSGSEMDLMGQQMALAEETGDYSHVAVASAAGDAPNPFDGDPELILARSFSALHDPAEAGVVPVAQRVMPIPTTHTVSIGLIDTTSGEKTEPTQVVVFDWAGCHYIYNPQLGTYGAPIPANPLTKQPYLCIANGDKLESVNFCATYPKAHPGEKAELIAPPGGPYGAVYTANGSLHYFSPFFGRADIPPTVHLALADSATHAKLLALLVEREQKRLVAEHKPEGIRAIPRSLAGDDDEMQAVRAYVALNAAGVPVQLAPGAGHAIYTVTGRWGITPFSQNF